TNASIFFTFLISIVFISCKNETKKDEPPITDVAKTETVSMPAYDPAMDPVNVEAKFLKMHKDTLGIKLYEVTLNPGDSAGIHNHPDHILYVVQGGTLRIYSKDGKRQDSELPTGAAAVIPAESHYGLNVGNTTLKLVVADIYRPRS
ncbi:MAG TPA: cupin domain-containing protein, partial [Chitinophagaceae bacterium]|nr:cupin domain-containing protein [Chitinophagaceae bacterium]